MKEKIREDIRVESIGSRDEPRAKKETKVGEESNEQLFNGALSEGA